MDIVESAYTTLRTIGKDERIFAPFMILRCETRSEGISRKQA
jgi:hypothetical protein